MTGASHDQLAALALPIANSRVGLYCRRGDAVCPAVCRAISRQAAAMVLHASWSSDGTFDGTSNGSFDGTFDGTPVRQLVGRSQDTIRLLTDGDECAEDGLLAVDRHQPLDLG